jgi:L,D-transpeptidase-like protein
VREAPLLRVGGAATVVAAFFALAPAANAASILDDIFKQEPPPPTPVPDRPPPAAEPQPMPPPTPAKGHRPRTRRLSNERTVSRWVYLLRRTAPRRAPSRRAARVARLRTLTSDGTPELVLALSMRRDRHGRLWVRVRLPMRPNGRKGWIPRSHLGSFHTVRTRLWIDRGRLTAKLYRSGRLVWRSRIGVGRPGWPTPAGRFYVRERLIPLVRGSVYGVFAFGTSAYSPVLTDWPGGGVVGIHGTNEPDLIPGRISHGCIRVRNAPILQLRRLMPLGTPIRIL